MDKYKKLMGNTLIFGIGSFGTKLLGFFLAALYTRVMSESEYSTADLIYNTVNILVPLVTFSMADAVIRFGMDKKMDKRRVYTGANACLLVGMVVFALFTPLVAANGTLGKYSFLMYMYCYFSCFRQLASQFVRSQGYVKLFALDGIVTTLIQVIANLVLLLGFRLGVTGYVISIIVSDVFSLAFLAVMANLHKYVSRKFIDKRTIFEMLVFSVPLIPTYLLWWITSASDRWFMIEMVGSTENGIYSLAYKLPTLLMLVTTMFYQAWQMSAIEEKDSREIGKFFGSVFKTYSSLIFVAAAGLILFCKPFTMILAGSGDKSRFIEAYMYSPILIAAMVFQCFCQFLSSVYSTKKKSVNSCTTALVAAAVNILLNFLLIPKFHAYGAAIATAAAYFACFIVRLFDTRRYINFRVNYLRIIINTVITLYMCVLVATKMPFYLVQLIVLFVLSCAFNFGAVVKLLRKLLMKRNTRKTSGEQNNAAM